jgi:hypothetical protein
MALKASGRHSAACDKYERLDSVYGVGSTVLTAIVGSTIFVTLQKTASEAIRITAGLVAAVAAVASGIQTAAKYGQLAERYRQASRQYATVARHIDEILADPPTIGQLSSVLDQLRKTLDDAGALAPNVPPRIWKAGPDERHRLAFPSLTTCSNTEGTSRTRTAPGTSGRRAVALWWVASQRVCPSALV